MFETPAQSHVHCLQSTEGCSDENPIWLYGESEERFRALLSVIYDLYAHRLSTHHIPTLMFSGGQIAFLLSGRNNSKYTTPRQRTWTGF